MAKFVVEFSPPEKIKFEPNDVIESVINYRMVLAPFQKQTQIEFNNVKLREISVRFLTFINPLDKLKQLVLTPPGDGFCFGVYKFTVEPYSQYELAITWQPSEYGNVRKLIKIEQVDSNRKYDFVVLGNCNSPFYKQFKDDSFTHSKSKNTYLVNKQFIYDKQNISPIKKKVIDCKTERIISVENPEKIPETSSTDTLQSIRRETFIVREKENVPLTKKNILGRDTILTSPERSIKRPYQTCQDHVFNNHFSFKSLNKSSSPISDDSLEKPLVKLNVNKPQLDDFCLTPLKSTENLVSHIGTIQKSNSFYDQLNIDITDESFASSSFKIEDSLVTDVAYITKNRTSPEVFMNFCSNCIETPENGFSNATVTLSGTKSRRPSCTIKNSYYKCSSTLPTISQNKLKQCSNLSPQTTRIINAPKLDKYDEYLKSLTNPDLLYHNNAKDPFLNMSQYYETEWLNRQESDMIRWLNALLTPTDKLVDEEQSGDLEQAAMAWVEVSKTSHKNKPMQLATQKDLFAAQIYRQSPQQWSALRKATTNLILSTNVSSVLSKLTVSIEKDLISVRDDRQIHLDLSLKRKIIDLFKCYNSLWFRIGLEAIYGQIVHLKSGNLKSNDLDGVGWFVRKNLFSNDYVKKKFIKTTVLQVNLPSYNIAMKKFILKKILMLIFFLDRAKEQQLIRHNPCLFQTNSPYKSSYDLLMAFCADTVTAHGDIVRRLRSIGYNLTHKQTHLDEVNYAVKSLNDLRDGTRITRVVEILFKGNPLSQKLRLPAISKLQKIHNVNLAFTRIAQHISIEGNITTRDVVNGHREKILSLFWQIIYKFLTPRYNTAATKIQNWWRNSSLKLVILKRIRAKQIAKRHLAATKIQAFIRGHLIRKQWPVKQEELIKNRKILHLASTKIKHYLKDKLKHLTNERKQFIILRRSVVFVQRKFRTKLAMLKERQKYLKAKQSAVIIQKIFRGFLLRKNWSRIRNDLSAEKTNLIFAIGIIKRALRRNLPPTRDHLEFLKLKHTVLYIQRQYMANRLMKLHRKYFITLKKTTITIQQRFRSKIAQRHYFKIKQSILIIQKVFRGFLVRKHWIEIQSHLILEKKKKINAINIVKRTLRRNLPPTKDRLKFVKLKQIIKYIESLYIANKSMNYQMKQYATLKKSTLIIQQKFRAKIIMKIERGNYLKIKQSVLLLQKVFRGFIVRKYWLHTQNRLILEKKKRINAINIIKRALRRNLPETLDRTNFVRLMKAVLFVQQVWKANFKMKKQRECYLKSRYTIIFIQRKFRAKIAMRTNRQNYLKIKQSVIMIQKIYCGFDVRKNWLMVKNNLTVTKARRVHSANVIKHILRKNLPATLDRLYYEKLRYSVQVVQRRFRANITMRKQLEEYQKLKNSVIVIQQKFRAQQIMKIERERYVIFKTSIIRLQSSVRGYLARKQWPILHKQLCDNQKRLAKYANLIKKTLRKCLLPTEERNRFLELRRSVVVIQQRFRANASARRQRTIFIRTKVAVIVLQAYTRGYLVRRQWSEIKDELQAHQNQLVAASNTIKRFLRRCLPNRTERSNFLRLRQIAILVQTQYRTIVSARILRTKYLQMVQSEITLRRQNKELCVVQATVILQAHIRGYLARRQWPLIKYRLKNEQKLTTTLLDKNNAVCIIQRVFRRYLIRKKHFSLNNQLQLKKQLHAATLIQAHWRGYCVRKRYQCRQETVKIPTKKTLTLGRRHNDVVNVINKQERNAYYVYIELSKVFWNLDTCTSLSKELCIKTIEGTIIDYIFRFLQYSNQSQPSIEAREPAIRVLTNLLRYHETSQLIWTKTVNTNIVKELIKMMKTSCGKFGATYKLYCSIATWIWIALQDPQKKQVILLF
ncbi:Hypothetical protein CINCED_3A000313 [Cinara cedri]|uniref:Calponin-homology (CH) domain-containing protein n=1 Tax=Cinara cedri TaxID=506608 RepID=A0A5E4N307_9HEMI|nr:Hypothetical protein CINCED_3A000313 [Cinara cedri]